MFDSSTFKRVERSKVEQIGKRGGEVVGTNIFTVSPNGKELHQVTNGKYANGQRYQNESFWTRAGPSTSDDPFIGTWRNDPTRMKIGVPVMYTISDADNGIQLESSVGLAYTAKFDGKPYPTTGVAAGTTVSLEKIDPHTIRQVLKRKDGSVSRVSTLSVSGNTLTEKADSTDPSGVSLKAVNVFDKQ